MENGMFRSAVTLKDFFYVSVFLSTKVEIEVKIKSNPWKTLVTVSAMQ